MSSWVPAPDSPRITRFARETMPEPLESVGTMLRRRMARGTEPEVAPMPSKTTEWFAGVTLALLVALAFATAFSVWGPGS